MARQQIPHQIYKDQNGVEHVRVRGGIIRDAVEVLQGCYGGNVGVRQGGYGDIERSVLFAVTLRREFSEPGWYWRVEER